MKDINMVLKKSKLFLDILIYVQIDHAIFQY
jgi:hypothetical protein